MPIFSLALQAAAGMLCWRTPDFRQAVGAPHEMPAGPAEVMQTRRAQQCAVDGQLALLQPTAWCGVHMATQL